MRYRTFPCVSLRQVALVPPFQMTIRVFSCGGLELLENSSLLIESRRLEDVSYRFQWEMAMESQLPQMELPIVGERTMLDNLAQASMLPNLLLKS